MHMLYILVVKKRSNGRALQGQEPYREDEG